MSEENKETKIVEDDSLMDNIVDKVKEVAIKDVKIGDKIPILENKQNIKTETVIVEGVVRVRGNIGDKDNRIIAIWSKELDDAIYVTEHHKIYEQKSKKWVEVKDALEVDTYETNIEEEELICLITNNGIIPIGEHIFADWEME